MITEGDSRIFTHSIETGEEITLTRVISTPESILFEMSWPSGRAIISDTVGYTETHAIHAVAYDAAGNKQESEPVLVQVVHKDDEDEEGLP